MFLWIVLALLTAAVAAALLLPFARRTADPPSHAGELEVYRDQLKEIDRDRDQGLIGAEEADYARAEVSRRLLAAAGAAKPAGPAPLAEPAPSAGSAKSSGAAEQVAAHTIVTPQPRRHRLSVALVTILPPLLGLCLYIMLGHPGLPDQPLQARLDNPGNNLDILVTKAEQHLASNPSDGAGWDLLAPIYVRMTRFGDAELAYRNAIRLVGPSAARLSGLGEALVAMSDGVVTEDARAAFEQAARLDPKDPRPRFYLGLGLEQAGRMAEAKATFEEIARQSPPDAPWMPLVKQHIAKASDTASSAPVSGEAAAQATTGGGAGDNAATGAQAGQGSDAATGGGQAGAASGDGGAGRAPGGPSQADVAAAENLSAGDRQAMIRGMVDSLAARLKDEPNNIEGWLRLVRSYSVLGDRNAAQETLDTGLAHFTPGSAEAQRLTALAEQIGLVPQAKMPSGSASPSGDASGPSSPMPGQQPPASQASDTQGAASQGAQPRASQSQGAAPQAPAPQAPVSQAPVQDGGAPQGVSQ